MVTVHLHDSHSMNACWLFFLLFGEFKLDPI